MPSGLWLISQGNLLTTHNREGTLEILTAIPHLLSCYFGPQVCAYFLECKAKS